MNRTIILLMASLVLATLVAGGTAVYALAGHGGGSVPSITGCVLGTGKLVKFKVGDVPKQPCGGATEVHLSGGDITAVLAGNGLIAGGTQGSVTLAVDPGVVQNRVKDSCRADSAITQIDEDGSVVCGGGDVTGVLAGTGLTGGGTQGSVTLGVDPKVVQNRVKDFCGADSAITQINEDGTVVCDQDDGFTFVDVIGGGSFNSDSPKSITLTCPAGTKPIGGGSNVGVGPSGVFLERSTPTFTGWVARASEQPPTDANWRLDAIVKCAASS